MDKKKSKRFKLFLITYVAIMIAMCVVGSVVPANENTWARGATIYYPFDDSVMGSEFAVSGNVYSELDIEKVELIIYPKGEIISVERETVVYEDEVIRTLSSFKTPIKIDEDGEHELSIQITDSSNTYELDKVSLTVENGANVKNFELFASGHLLSILLVVVVCILMIIIYKKSPVAKTKKILYLIISAGIVICDITVKMWLLKNGVFKASYDMFLHMCDISGPLLIILFFMQDSKLRRKLFSLMFIWGVLGAAMALLTPEMKGYAFPSFYYFNFFIKHGLIIIGVVLVGVTEKYSPKMKHLPVVIGVSVAIVAVIYFINLLIVFLPPYEAGNYMFLIYPPTGGSAIDILVDIFGPSPFYIIGMVLLALVLYIFMWFIYAVIAKIKSLRKK